MKPCSILIANFNGHEAIELCIESILKKTVYPSYKILVFDSSGKDSQDRTYLTSQQQRGNIELFISDVQARHASALMRLLAKCETPLACMVDSDIEVLKGEWLRVLVDELKSPNDMGVAKTKVKGIFPSGVATVPIFQPFCLLLNMENYRKVANGVNWQEKAIPREEYKGSWILPKSHPRAYGDVGWQLAEKIMFDNPNGFIMREMPEKYMLNYLRHYGGLSAHHANPDHPRVRDRWQLCKIRLKALRGKQ